MVRRSLYKKAFRTVGIEVHLTTYENKNGL